MSPKAIFFDVDFTLIYPGPMFRAEGYQAFCARHGDISANALTWEDLSRQPDAHAIRARAGHNRRPAVVGPGGARQVTCSVQLKRG